jgi:hypothetical protein
MVLWFCLMFGWFLKHELAIRREAYSLAVCQPLLHFL